MKVVILGHSYYARENRKQLTELARRVTAPVEVVLPRTIDRGGLFRYSGDDVRTAGRGYRFHVLGPWPSDDHLRGILLSLKATITKIEPDVVHCEWAPYSGPGLQLAMLKRLRIVDFLYTALLRQPIVNFRGRWYGAILSALMTWALDEFDGFQVSSSTAERAFRDAMAVERANMPKTYRAYQTGVDTKLFRPPDRVERSQAREELGVDDESIVVGFCGRLVEEKGLIDLIEAVAFCNHRLGESADVCVALLGSGPLEEDILDAGRDLGVSVSLHPVRPHSEVARFMWALDICVLPSHESDEWVEHDAHVLVEAMSCGVPVLGTTSGAIREVVADAGLLTAPDSPEALASGIMQILGDEEEARRRASKGRTRAVDRFSHEVVAEQMVGAWTELLGIDG